MARGEELLGSLTDLEDRFSCGSALQSELGVQQSSMEVLRRSSVFAAEVMEVFDRSPTDKELVSQAKALCRDYINSRLIQAGVSWSKPEYNAPVPGGKLAEVSTILLRLGESWQGELGWGGGICTRLRFWKRLFGPAEVLGTGNAVGGHREGDSISSVRLSS